MVCCTRIPHIKHDNSHHIYTRTSNETVFFFWKNRIYLSLSKIVKLFDNSNSCKKFNEKLNNIIIKRTNIHLARKHGIATTRMENQWVHYTAELHNCTLVTRPVWRAKCIVRDCLFLLLCWFYTPVGGALSRRTTYILPCSSGEFPRRNR